MVALALPLAPLAPGAAAAAGTFVIGSAAYIAQQVHGFRAPLPAPMIPRTGGKAGGATMQEMVADAIAGARIPVAFPPNPLGPRGSLGLVGLLAAAGLIGSGVSQIWGLFKQKRGTDPDPNNWYPDGPLRAVNGDYLRICNAWNSGCITGQPYFQEFVSLKTSAPQFSNGVWTYVVTQRFKLANGQTIDEVASGRFTLDEVRRLKVVVMPGQAATGTVTAPAALVPGTQPEVQPEVQPLPQIPLVPKAPPTTEPQPVPERSPTPVAPGPAPPAWWRITKVYDNEHTRQLVPEKAQQTEAGKLVPTRPAPVTVTHPDAHYPIPGGGPITGNGPQAKPEEIAKELGRLEQKLNAMLSPTPDTPVEWQEFLKQLWEMFQNLKDAKTYTITEKCPPCDGSQYDPPKVEVTAPGATDALGVIANRIDALAVLLDGQLGLKQQICPPCKPQLSGEWVSVHFVSDEASPGGEKPLRKRFRYLDQTFAPLADHVAHWEHFEWDAGPVIVVSKNLSWGVPKVWAATAAEGKRVIRHAAQIAGVNLQDPRHQWIVTGSGDPRYGQTGHMRVDTRGGQFVRITKRPGPDGLPTGVAPTS